MIDFHCHIGRLLSEELNERYGIPEEAGGAFLHSTLQRVREVEKAFATLYASPHINYGDSLNWLLSEVKPFKELIPVPVIHPQLKATTPLLEELNPKQVPGIKIHCESAEFGHYSLGDYNLLAPTYSYAEENGLVMFVHTDSRTCFANKLAPLLANFQATTVLLHCCREEGIILTRYPSVYLETSGCGAKDVRLAMTETPDRVLFGSDFPLFDYNASLINIKEHIPQIEANEKEVMKELSLCRI